MKVSPNTIFSPYLWHLKSIKPLLNVHSIAHYLPLTLISSISTQVPRLTNALRT